jgi:hypothetical protein
LRRGALVLHRDPSDTLALAQFAFLCLALCGEIYSDAMLLAV